MRIFDIIQTKQECGELSSEELAFVIDGVCDGSIGLQETSAWLMAVFNNGMSSHERNTLTRLMRDSGDIMDWGKLQPLVVDKHSTGGVGDKMSLILAPALAACGLKVPMISGRGLAHTGGTIDKLEAIPDFNSDGSEADVKRLLNEVGCCIYAQSQRIAPADGILYAIRDVTGTVASVPLITASIISKKAAEGLSCLLLDVKVGRAAFMNSVEQARELATSMVEAGRGLGMQVRCLLTRMDHPIGTHIGNSHEIIETLDILDGQGPADSISLIVEQGAHLLQMSKQVETVEAGRNNILERLGDGVARQHFIDMCIAQGVTFTVANNIREHLDIAPNRFAARSPSDGWVEDIDALSLAMLASSLGAGRTEVGQPIDHGVGIIIHAKVGSRVSKGETVLSLDHREQELSPQKRARLESCINISSSPTKVPQRLIEVIE